MSGTSPGERRVGDRRTPSIGDARYAWLPMTAVIASLVLLVIIPLLVSWRLKPLHEEMRAVAEPARRLVTRIHVALAIEGAAVADYLVAQDEVELRRYQQARESAADAYARLAPLADRLDPAVRERLARLEQLQQGWEAHVVSVLAGRGRRGAAHDAGHEQLYDDLLVAAALLDEAISDASQERSDRILAAERLQRWLLAVLGLVALAASAIVAWLARRLREAALHAEERRAALERATESRARLMRGMSHDLKNPINAIDGHAELMEVGLRGPLTEAQAESVARIRRAVRALLALIEDLLELSRAETGQLRLVQRECDVGALTRAVVEEARASAVASGLTLEVESDAALAVVTDADRVRQVLGNLVSNAIKYTPAGGHVRVRAERRERGDAAGTWAAVSVVDDGPGIPRVQHEAIFEEFLRLSAHSDKPGAGLGLSIARRIARLLGGDVTVASEAGAGSAFTLWLPASRSEPPAPTG